MKLNYPKVFNIVIINDERMSTPEILEHVSELLSASISPLFELVGSDWDVSS